MSLSLLKYDCIIKTLSIFFQYIYIYNKNRILTNPPQIDTEKQHTLPPDGAAASHHSSRSSSQVGVTHSSSSPAVQCPAHTTPARITTKIDLHLVPFLIILYLTAFLDRVNIANARTFGLEADLGLTSLDYNTALTIFFVPYILCEIPSNILLKRFSPRIWLSICCLGFGIVTICQGFVQNYGGLLTTRFFLGVFECGMFPGCFYLLGMWYRREEAQKRFSLFFGSTSLAGAFGGLLAGAIGKMDGVRGWNGWRWIFVLEGAGTVVIGLIFLLTFPGFVEDAVRKFFF